MSSEDTSPIPPLINNPPGFHINPVDYRGNANAPQTSPPDFLDDLPDTPDIGVLKDFKGSFHGNGLNTIWRPNNTTPTATTFPNPLSPDLKFKYPVVLELNLVQEVLSFGPQLGSVPNRGFQTQKDIFLNGVSYVQSINDVTNEDTGKGDGPETGIHYEPGLWMFVPKSESPNVPKDTLTRMGSIPHGTTINAQGKVLVKDADGAPRFDAFPTSILPFKKGSQLPLDDVTIAANQARFGSVLDVANSDQPRLPQDLTLFNAAQTIDNAILKDVAQVLIRANIGKKILKTTVFQVSTDPLEDASLNADEFTPDVPHAKTYGGGTANIAFLSGDNVTVPSTTDQIGDKENANAAKMTSTFWINTVEHTIKVPKHPGRPNGGPIVVSAPIPNEGHPVTKFKFTPPNPVKEPIEIKVTSKEIQYIQNVDLNFFKITWPHVSVATLVPQAPVEDVPDSVFPKPA